MLNRRSLSHRFYGRFYPLKRKTSGVSPNEMGDQCVYVFMTLLIGSELYVGTQ
jgi:hypothetical protein